MRLEDTDRLDDVVWKVRDVRALRPCRLLYSIETTENLRGT